jgi:flagellar export protein FliJ
MKTYNQLVRLHEYRLHERQKALAELDAQAAELKLKVERLDAEMLIEEARAEETQLGSAAFASYFKRASEKRVSLSEARNAVARKILAARTELKHAFDELKRIETLRDRKAHEMEQEAKRLEQAELDEAALQQHHRNSG